MSLFSSLASGSGSHNSISISSTKRRSPLVENGLLSTTTANKDTNARGNYDNSNNNRSPPSHHHVVVDLACNKVEAALDALHNMPMLAAKVRTATVHADSLHDSRCGRITFDKKHVERIFDGLASLPRLVSLTVELNFHVICLPVSALLKILQPSGRGGGDNNYSSLRKLQLKHLQMIGSREEFDQLQTLARTQNQLESLTLVGCRGVSGIRALLQHLPALTDLKIISSAIAPLGNLQDSDLVEVLHRNPMLRVLHLEDVTDLEDQQCKALAKALRQNTSLQSFYLSSSMLTDTSAEALAKMLLINVALERVTLHLDAEWLGSYIAPVVQANTSLRKLDIRIYNDLQALSEGCIELAQALKHNTRLRALRLRLEIELESLPTEVIQAFAEAINTPTVVLESLSLDDGMYRYPLSAEMKFLLQLNHCGVRQLLQRRGTATLNKQVETLIQTTLPPKQPKYQQPQAKAKAKAKTKQSHDNLNATFYLLQNTPELIHAALQNYENGILVDDTTDEDHEEEENSRDVTNVIPSVSSCGPSKDNNRDKKKRHNTGSRARARSSSPSSSSSSSSSKKDIMSMWKQAFPALLTSGSNNKKAKATNTNRKQMLARSA